MCIRDSSYSMLSSGEQVKVNVAFLLAFAKIQNYKILLLDEATRHLDKTNTNRIIKYISRSFDGKIISAEHTEGFEEHKTLTLVEYVER
jgi:ATPase subunit of ABC transporter with duplicated ATPase domains